MLKVKSPGKIMLAGEWSVLETGNFCIVTTVDKFVEASITASNNIIFHAPDVGLQNVTGFWDGQNFRVDQAQGPDFAARFKFCFYSTQVSLQFLQEQSKKIGGFEISIKSELSTLDSTSSQFLKLGLGSSAATTVVVCKAILALHGFDVESDYAQDIIFKLACIAHYLASGKIGSGFDVAASTYQTALAYSRFDTLFLENAIRKGLPMSDLVSIAWPSLSIEKLQLPADLRVVVGFSGVSASTTEMIKKMHEFKTNKFDGYKSIFDDINSIVLKLISAIQESNKTDILSLIAQNRQLLINLSLMSGVELETPVLKHMITQAELCGAAAKFSGAGGGDCVIALCFDNCVAQKIKNIWQQGFIVNLK